MYQKLVAIGRISEPESRKNGNGNLFIRFGLAVQEGKEDEPTWLNCILGGKFAEVMEDKLSRGQLIFVEGRLSVRKNGETTYTNIMVDTLRILRDPNSEGRRPEPEEEEEFADDIPF